MDSSVPCNSWPTTSKPLCCKMPPCPCDMCVQRRANDELDRIQCTEEACKHKTNRMRMRNSFSAFLYEFIGIVAFLMMATTIFWFAVARRVYGYTIQIALSEKKERTAALILIALLVLSISFSCTKLSWRNREPPREQTPGRKVQQHHSKAPVAKPNRYQQIANACMSAFTVGQRQNITESITHDKPHKIYQESRLCTIPLEMKNPPTFLVYLRDVILRHLVNTDHSLHPTMQ